MNTCSVAILDCNLMVSMELFALFQLDIDECVESPTRCGPASHCNNMAGGYSCTCWSGHTRISGNETDGCEGKISFHDLMVKKTLLSKGKLNESINMRPS